MSDEHEIETAITAYRAQLQAEAELGRSDLAEIEDHLRELVTELRETGMPVAVAVTEAARRLGEPAALAREHARVRTPFGAKLSRARAWSACLLFVPLLYTVVSIATQYGDLRGAADSVIGAGLIVALAFRLTWARAIMLGIAGFGSVWMLVTLPLAPGAPLIYLVLDLGIVAFLMPWRRGELAAPGWALALLYTMYCGASWATSQLAITTQSDDFVTYMTAALALTMTLSTGAGIVLRARWAAITAAVACAMLVMCLANLGSLTYRFAQPDWVRSYAIGVQLVGAVTAAVVAWLAWVSARTNFGTVRSLLR